MKRLLYIGCAWVLLLFTSCKENEVKPVKENRSNILADIVSSKDPISFYHSEKVVEIDRRGNKKTEVMNYTLGSISALDFIQRKGKEVDPADRNSLEQEQVIILEMELENQMKSVFESKRLQIDKNKVIEYINGNIPNDIWIEQDGKEFRPKGHQYENSFGKQNRMRIYFFFKGLDRNKDFRTVYNDRLYGSGLINFRIKANHDL